MVANYMNNGNCRSTLLTRFRDFRRDSEVDNCALCNMRALDVGFSADLSGQSEFLTQRLHKCR